MTSNKKTLRLQIFLFLLTIITTTMAGAEWLGNSIWSGEFTFGDFLSGLTFSIPFLLILTIHEFGHYFTAQYHKVKVTLPYYIPMWFFGVGASIGTMGAFIKIQGYIESRKKYFDIGIAGPLAGFAVALLVLWVGFTNIPPLEHLFAIHPEYEQWGANYTQYAYTEAAGIQFQIGPNLLFWFFETYVADPGSMPHPNEVIHYPLLFAGYLALFFTALNLLPIGQLDGGHILYGLVGAKWHSRIASVLFVAFISYAGIGVLNPYDLGEWFAFYIMGYLAFLYFCCYTLTPKPLDRLMVASAILTFQFAISYWIPGYVGYSGWLVFGFLIGRFLGVHHPPVHDDRPLSTGRIALGLLSLVVFILCFSPEPFVVE
jgi:membrane-associated protease RseP (regulator of RpoE activity)